MTKFRPLLVLLAMINVAFAHDPAPTIRTDKLHPADLAGTWSGQRKLNDGDSISVLVKFRGSDHAMDPESVWIRERTPRLGITGLMKLIDDDKPNSVAIQYNYIEGKTNKAGSAIIGNISRNDSGDTFFTLLPSSKRFDFHPFSKVSIRQLPPNDKPSTEKRNPL